MPYLRYRVANCDWWLHDYTLTWCLASKAWFCNFSFFGVLPVIVDEKGTEIDGDCSGYLCVKNLWPGEFRTLYGYHDRYETTYFKPFPGYYFTGDGCSRDKDAYHWLTGRVDDVINVSGHRIGTTEVESALVSHPQSVEAAVIGVEHEDRKPMGREFCSPIINYGGSSCRMLNMVHIKDYSLRHMIYGRGPMPTWMAMVPMALADGRVGYVL